MSFTTEVKYLHSISGDISKLSSLITPSLISNIHKLNLIDMSKTDELVTSITTLQEASTDMKNVLNGLDSINNVLKIQNQVQYVSDIRDSVGLVAGSIDEIKKTADYVTTFGGVLAMQPMIEDVLVLSYKMDEVIDLEEKMDAMLAVEDRLEKKLDVLHELAITASNAATEAKTALYEVIHKEKQIDKKLEEMKGYRDEMVDFNITTEYIPFDGEPVSAYDVSSNTLLLRVREGRPGIKGDPGSDGKRGVAGSVEHRGKPGLQGEPGKPGKELKIDVMGAMAERKRYGNRPIGTTFLALDKKIPMLYFRKSNTLDDWTDGIPFGSNPIKHADSATDTEKLMGMSLVQLKAYINK